MKNIKVGIDAFNDLAKSHEAHVKEVERLQKELDKLKNLKLVDQLTEETLKELGFKKETCEDDIGDGWEEQTYYTYDLSDDKYTDLCLLSSYVKRGGDMVVELFPYESFKYNTLGEVKMLIESIKSNNQKNESKNENT